MQTPKKSPVKFAEPVPVPKPVPAPKYSSKASRKAEKESRAEALKNAKAARAVENEPRHSRCGNSTPRPRTPSTPREPSTPSTTPTSSVPTTPSSTGKSGLCMAELEAHVADLESKLQAERELTAKLSTKNTALKEERADLKRAARWDRGNKKRRKPNKNKITIAVQRSNKKKILIVLLI